MRDAPPPGTRGLDTHAHPYLTESDDKVVLQKSIPAQIRQLILHHRLYKESVVEFVQELTLAKRLYKHIP